MNSATLGERSGDRGQSLQIILSQRDCPLFGEFPSLEIGCRKLAFSS